MAGLLANMWGSGIVAEVRRRIAAPMVSGMIASTVLTLGVIPALYALVKQWQLRRAAGQDDVAFTPVAPQTPVPPLSTP